MRSGAFRHLAPRFRLLPDIPADRGAVAPAFETRVRLPGAPPLCADLGRCAPHLRPAVLAPAGCCWPFLPRLATASAGLQTSVSLPSFAGYRNGLWPARLLLPGLQTCRTCTAVRSRMAVCSFRRASGPCTPPMLPYQHWPSGRGKKPLAPPMLPPSASRGDPMATARAFARATALLVARLLGCSDRAHAQPASGFYLRASSPHVTPRTAGYDAGATWGMAPAGLPPASTAVRLAALPPVGPVGRRFPTFLGTMRRYDCHLPLSGSFACRSFPDTLPASMVRGLPSGLVAWSKRPDSARAFGHPVPHSGHVVKETDGSPKFPSSPCEDMPRSQTPVVSCALALPHPGLLPSSHWKPSAYHDYTHFGAQSRGLSPRSTRLRTAPYGEARGVTTDLLARL